MTNPQSLGQVPRVGHRNFFVFLAGGLAKDAVDEAGESWEAVLLGEFHGGVDGGGVGDLVEVVNLVESELEDDAQVGGLTTGGFAGKIVDAGVQAALAT